MNLLKFLFFGIILVGYQTIISNAVRCYGCYGGDDVSTHWRFAVNDTQGFYPPKCSAGEIEAGYALAPKPCDKSCGVVKLTRFDEEGMITFRDYYTISRQ